LLSDRVAGVESAQLEMDARTWTPVRVAGGVWRVQCKPGAAQAVIDYIEGQEEHHRKWTFEQEFLTLLKRAEVEFDTRFVFG
jgi:hypothetical protein